jgi:hypothetical protein
MRRAAQATASSEEMQLFCTVTACELSGRPQRSKVTRARFGD